MGVVVKHTFFVDDNGGSEKRVIADFFITTDSGDLVFMSSGNVVGKEVQARAVVAYAAGQWFKVRDQGVAISLMEKDDGQKAND